MCISFYFLLSFSALSHLPVYPIHCDSLLIQECGIVVHLPYSPPNMFWSVKELASLWGPDLTECCSLTEQVAVYGVPAVYCLCDVWGPLCLQTRHGKDGEAPSNAAFVWTGGGISVWRWNPDQTIPPVADQVAGSSTMRAESDTASISCFLALCFGIEETCGYCEDS